MFESLNGTDTYRMFKFFIGREVGFVPEQAVYLFKDMVEHGRVFPTSRRRIEVGGVEYPVDYVYPQDAVAGDSAAFIVAPDWFNGQTIPQCVLGN